MLERRAQRGVTAATLAVVLGASAGAVGQAAPLEPGAAPEGGVLGPGNKDDEWTLRLELMAWYASPGGDLEMPGLELEGEAVRLSTLNLDSPRLSPLVELTVASGDWRLAASGFSYSIDGREMLAEESGEIGGVGFSEGETISSSLDFASWQAAARYEFYEWPKRPTRNGSWPFVLSAEAVGGLRFYAVDMEAESAGGRASHDEFFADPYVGLRIVMDVAERLTLDVEATLGYFASGDREVFSNDIMVGFMYRPTENLGVQIGYRQLAFDLISGDDEDEFEFGGSLAGVYAGAVLRF